MGARERESDKCGICICRPVHKYDKQQGNLV